MAFSSDDYGILLELFCSFSFDALGMGVLVLLQLRNLYSSELTLEDQMLQNCKERRTQFVGTSGRHL